jgi:CheY-like chemotaxis protein
MDDDLETLDLYRAVLEDEGYRVTLASSPAIDAAAVATLAPDAILLDLRFPRKTDGLAVLARLKADPGTVAIPVLVCSGDIRLLDEVQEQLLAWDCAVLPKPFDLDPFLAAVQGRITPRAVSPANMRRGSIAPADDAA